VSVGTVKKTEMVDITGKKVVFREATALGEIKLKPETVTLIKTGGVAKGDPLTVAEIAGTMAAKETSRIIPLCHPIPVTNVSFKASLDGERVRVEATVKTNAKTGVEMEALTAVATYLLTVWDMVKKYEKDREGQYPTTVIESIRVERKIKGFE